MLIQKLHKTQTKNKITPITTLILSVCIFMSIGSSVAHAADLDFVCDSDGCSLDSTSSSKAFFNGDKIVPGDSITKTLKVRNELDSACYIYVDTKNESYSPATFVNNLYTAIEVDGSTVYGEMLNANDAAPDNTLGDLFAADSVRLSSISSSSSEEFDWTVTFSQETNNIYQGKKVSFDVDIIMECPDVNTDTEVEYEYYEVEVYVDENGNEIDPNDFIQEEQTVVQSAGQLLGIADENNSDGGGKNPENDRRPPSEAFLDSLLNKLKTKATTVDEESTKLCTGNKRWLWFFVVQTLVHLTLTLLLKKNSSRPDKLFYGLMLLNFVVFVIIFLGIYCP